MSARDSFDDFIGDAVTGVRLAAERRRSELGFGIGAPDDTVVWPPEARRVPARIRLVPDDAAIEAVGTAQDGRRFMLAAPSDEHDYIALFLWTADGEFDRLLVDDLGATGEMSPDEELALYERRVTQLGEFTVEAIEVAPFAVEAYGTVFGLVAYEPDEDAEGIAWVEYLPGNPIAFCWPWDGTYF
jgi:hypothetical protein